MSSGSSSLIFTSEPLTVSISNHNATVKNNLQICTENQVQEYYRLWACSTPGRTTIEKIIKTVAEYGVGGGSHAQPPTVTNNGTGSNTNPYSIHHMLMSPHKGSSSNGTGGSLGGGTGGNGASSPLSPRGRSIGGYGSPGSPSSSKNLVRSLSETSYGFGTSLLSSTDTESSSSTNQPFSSSLLSFSSATTVPDPTSIAAAVAAAGGIGALLGTSTTSSLTTNGTTTGLSPHLGYHNSSSNGSNSLLRRSASASPTLSTGGVTSLSSSSSTTNNSSPPSSSTLNQRFDAVNPLSPGSSSTASSTVTNASMNSSSSSSATGTTTTTPAVSSPGIAIRISPGAAVHNNTLRRSLSGSSVNDGSFGLSPKKLSIGSPVSSSSSSSSVNSFSLDPDGGFVPSSFPSTTTDSTPSSNLPFGVSTGSILSPPSSSSSSSSSPSAMVSSVAAIAAASLSLPISPRLMRSSSAPPLTTVFNLPSTVTSPTYLPPFGTTPSNASSVGPASAISSPGSSPSMSTEASPVPSPRSTSPTLLGSGAGAQPRHTDSKYDDLSTNQRQSTVSGSYDGPPGKVTSTQDSKTTDTVNESKFDTLTPPSSVSTGFTMTLGATGGGKDLSSLLNAVASPSQESKQADDGTHKLPGGTVTANRTPTLPLPSEPVVPLPPGATKIPTFYRKNIGAISLGVQRKPVTKRPEALLTCPMPPVRTALPTPPAPKGLPLRSLENQRLEDQLTTILDIFRQANASTNPLPSNPLHHLRLSSSKDGKDKEGTTTTTNRSRSNSLTGKGGSSSNLSKSMPTSTANKGTNGNNRTSIGAGNGSSNNNRRSSTSSTGSGKDDVTDSSSSSTGPIKVYVATSNVNVLWEDAHTAVSLDSFATITKQLCGFPSFFAAPLFRRIKAMYGGNENNQGLPSVSNEWLNEATQAYTVYQASLPTDENSSSSTTTTVPASTTANRATSNGRGRASSIGNTVSTKPVAPSSTSSPLPPPFERTLPFTVHLNPYTPDESKNRDTTGVITLPQFLAFWRNELEPYDSVERFYRLVKQRNNRYGIQATDFMPFLEELLEYHPGLAFLENTPEFQDKYAKTVIARIFFTCDPTARRVIDLRALRNSNVVQAFHTVDVIEDINLVNEYFSYEHFYVLYCKFWELDNDHDFTLSRKDLSRLLHLTPTVLDRIFLRTGRPFAPGQPKHQMGYEDFCIFFLASEDKTNPSSLRYWFNVCDIDGDGVLTAADLRYFYPEQAQRMRDHGLEVVKFEDILCQLHDLLKPQTEGRILFRDFIVPDRIALTGNLFNALFDLDKFQRFESREGQFVKQIENYTRTQWERYAAVEYQRLASEEEENNVVDQGFNSYSMGGWGT